MIWTILVLLTVGWLLVLLAGIGGPWSWLLPAVVATVLLYRLARGARGG
jgi:hypothetical protein